LGKKKDKERQGNCLLDEGNRIGKACSVAHGKTLPAQQSKKEKKHQHMQLKVPALTRQRIQKMGARENFDCRARQFEGGRALSMRG